MTKTDLEQRVLDLERENARLKKLVGWSPVKPQSIPSHAEGEEVHMIHPHDLISMRYKTKH